MSNIYLSKKTWQTDASSGNSDLGVLDPKATDDGIEDSDKEHSDQIDVVQFVCCWLGIFKQSIFYIFLWDYLPVSSMSIAPMIMKSIPTTAWKWIMTIFFLNKTTCIFYIDLLSIVKSI